jgi:D-alanyl-D-alanine carboxypeptidase/D-alanyl-D-alanine-endopeptidase (penicillin-binding protein 4)
VRKVARLATLAAAVWLAIATSASAQGSELSLSAKLSKALHKKGVVQARTGALAVDLADGNRAFEQNAAISLEPASTEKLPVAVAALDELGPGRRITTLVLGEGAQDGTVWRGDLVLKGFGDPTLTSDDLAALARQIRAAGIRRLAGRVVGDESYFDSRRMAAGWKSSFYKIECPPLSALVVDRAWLDDRTVDEPALGAAIAFRRALQRAGIRVARKAVVGKADARAVELARVSSPPLRDLVAWMNSESDNFFAEMLLKVLGAEELGQGTTAAGARVVRRELIQRGVPTQGVRIVDGSGLSRNDRFTAQALAALLVSARRDTGIAQPFFASLALAGVSGTLEERMTRGPARGRVRAKTGTTDAASALVGYAGAYVFVLIMNGSPVRTEVARKVQDRFATILVASS